MISIFQAMDDTEVQEQIRMKNLKMNKTEISEVDKEKRFLEKVAKIYPNCLVCKEKFLKNPSQK